MGRSFSEEEMQNIEDTVIFLQVPNMVKLLAAARFGSQLRIPLSRVTSPIVLATLANYPYS